MAEAVVALRKIGLLLQNEKWESSVSQCTNPDIAINFKVIINFFSNFK